ncbi:MAG TPA: response regulator [Dongiaceae bacterium]|jgi:CheY-like chemotaxis protein|nr:response regulator [Dongiaceae bacterium]
MDDSELKDLSILVVEDEPVIAIDTACTVVRAGGSVVGPAYSLNEAFETIANTKLDGALLDINLRSEKVFRLADALADRGVPIVFITGEIWPVIPERHTGCGLVGKPINQSKVVRALRSAIDRGRVIAA